MMQNTFYWEAARYISVAIIPGAGARYFTYANESDARRSCRLFGIPSAERSCVNCAYVDLLHYQPPCNNCLRSPYAVHGETTDDAWKPIGKWQNP